MKLYKILMAAIMLIAFLVLIQSVYGIHCGYIWTGTKWIFTCR